MGDEKKYYTIQIKGTAYRFEPVSSEDATMLTAVINMNASPVKTIKAMTRVMKRCVGDEQWDTITDRLISNEIDLNDLMEAFKKLSVKTSKDVPADDAE